MHIAESWMEPQPPWWMVRAITTVPTQPVIYCKIISILIHWFHVYFSLKLKTFQDGLLRYYADCVCNMITSIWILCELRTHGWNEDAIITAVIATQAIAKQARKMSSGPQGDSNPWHCSANTEAMSSNPVVEAPKTPFGPTPQLPWSRSRLRWLHLRFMITSIGNQMFWL